MCEIYGDRPVLLLMLIILFELKFQFPFGGVASSPSKATAFEAGVPVAKRPRQDLVKSVVVMEFPLEHYSHFGLLNRFKHILSVSTRLKDRSPSTACGCISIITPDFTINATDYFFLGQALYDKIVIAFKITSLNSSAVRKFYQENLPGRVWSFHRVIQFYSRSGGALYNFKRQSDGVLSFTELTLHRLSLSGRFASIFADSNQGKGKHDKSARIDDDPRDLPPILILLGFISALIGFWRRAFCGGRDWMLWLCMIVILTSFGGWYVF
jgi:hypothetical protein